MMVVSGEKQKPRIMIFGALPPPYIGPSIATEILLNSSLHDYFSIIHMNTSDHRSPENIGKMDVINIYLAILQILRFFLLLFKYRPAVVYLPICQSLIGYLRDTVFIFASRLSGARVVIHLRGGYFRELYEKSNFLTKLIIRKSLWSVSIAIVLAESLKYIFKGLVPEDKIRVVPNGISRDYIKEEELSSAKNLRFNQGKQKILFLSNLILKKGFFDVIKAMPEVINFYKDAEFVFAGEFSEPAGIRKEVFAYIDKHGLGPHICFTGAVTGKVKKELLLSSNIFVFPTKSSEGQPWVIIEAMAAGLPVIAVDRGCIKEIVINNKNGFILANSSPKEIAAKIIFILKDEKLRVSMGDSSRRIYEERYSVEKFIDGLTEIFKEETGNDIS